MVNFLDKLLKYQRVKRYEKKIKEQSRISMKIPFLITKKKSEIFKLKTAIKEYQKIVSSKMQDIKEKRVSNVKEELEEVKKIQVRQEDILYQIKSRNEEIKCLMETEEKNALRNKNKDKVDESYRI